MQHERSYGIVPLRRNGSHWQVLMVQLKAGHWGFPKGHANPGEAPLDAAIRELEEETGLTVHQFLQESAHDEHYIFTLHGKKIDKTVTYFIAEVEGDLKLCEVEIKDARWLDLENAENQATFAATKAIARELILLFH